VTSDQNPEYDLIGRATILADNPYHANSYDVKQMALRILHYEKTARAINSHRVPAGRLYSKG
jgi:hypothetical protein